MDHKRIGRRVANVHVEAWQESRARPIAALHGHFTWWDVRDFHGNKAIYLSRINTYIGIKIREF